VEGKFVTYCRVSTARQGQSGLGLDAQRSAVERYLNGAKPLAEFIEVESGRKSQRPKLDEALKLAKKEGAVLVIAKLDRLARNVYFIAGLMESGVEFVAADMPTKDKFMLHIQASFAEEEARRISQRTRAALAEAKKRGVELGKNGKLLAVKYRQEAVARAKAMKPVIDGLIAEGIKTERAIAQALNDRGVPSPAGKSWHKTGVERMLARL
jgi:DNA invertase Pin-like site-specific DNA recombinase